MEFTIEIEVLAECLNALKQGILRYLKKNFKENVHYKYDGYYKQDKGKQIGNNRQRILVTQNCYELVKNSYNLRNKYLTEINDNFKCVNVVMCLENSTIGFIENSLRGIVNMRRQQIINNYRVDLYFPDTKLIVECDEDNHNDRNAVDERTRDNILTSLGNKVIHFNPNDSKFDLSNVLREIFSVIFQGKEGVHTENDNISTEEEEFESDKNGDEEEEEEEDKNDYVDEEEDKNADEDKNEDVDEEEERRHYIVKRRIEIKRRMEELKFECLKIQQENLLIQNKNLLLNLELKKQGIHTEPIIEENIVFEDEDEDEDEVERVPQVLGDITTCNFSMVKRDTGRRSPKVYQYNIEDLTNPIRIHDSPIDVERAFADIAISPAQLKRAAENNTIYKNFRWYFVRHGETIPETIPDTVVIRELAGTQFIAMIDITKTKIMKVYASQKDAVEARMMKCNGFTRAIKQESISSGHYWKYYKDCSEEMKNEYLSRDTLPEKFVNKSGNTVEQIDPRTRHVIKIYHSSREVAKDFQMSIASLKKASASGEIKNGYIWRING